MRPAKSPAVTSLSAVENAAPPKPRDECGVFAVYGHPKAAELTYYGLYALQHRGQESAGIVTADDAGTEFHVHKGMGLVPQVFNESTLQSLTGTRAIGHVRYSTTGSSVLKNAQPIVVDCARGQIAVAHNGNLVNADVLREELEARGSIFQTTVDSEVILHLMAQPLNANRENSLVHAIGRIQGAFSLVILSEQEVIGVRDPYGFRPLSLGKLGSAWILASETCAFDLIGAEFVRDLEPGELVILDQTGVRSLQPFSPPACQALCIFEYVYFARPDSQIEGINVSRSRIRMGAELAREHPIEADLVIPIPDSGNYAAMGYSEAAGIPYSQAFVRNHYVGRTFLQPSQVVRDLNVRIKLNLIPELVTGKRVVIVDDSIVRGTTSRNRVKTLRQAGAQEVHIRISCPPHRFACFYGIDFPDPADLIANQMSLKKIAEYLGADSIGYLSIEGLSRAVGRPDNKSCTACFTGNYPVPFDPDVSKLILEKRRDRACQSLVREEEELPLF